MSDLHTFGCAGRAGCINDISQIIKRYICFWRSFAPIQRIVQSDNCCNLVFVKNSDTIFRPRKVTLGVESKGYVEVMDGVAEGEQVVTTGSFLMKTEILKGSIGAGCCEVDPGR